MPVYIGSRAHYYFIPPIIALMMIPRLYIWLSCAHFVLLYYCINTLHRSATSHRYFRIHTLTNVSYLRTGIPLFYEPLVALGLTT
ncbi:uncharacterized protein F5147DRAFT_7400 [Suillus discolor]|uniref:Uncharacterized protein n=1 Tax=Suillus discolor TaxID=1912936 RepID=A0A9P7FJT0_9AGAM|nr:uncharacterized protein F5147DRAFT_7400 [Suillus discolor]KAG2120728.1 hypothetical protein F5147DRAFT_7400 [Suillus discolor]